MDDFELLVYKILGNNTRVNEFLKLRNQFNAMHIEQYYDIPEEIIAIERDRILDEIYQHNKIFLHKAVDILGPDDFYKLFELPVDQIDNLQLPKFN